MSDFPKSVKKFLRYVKQDCPEEKLQELKEAINYAIDLRKRRIQEKKKG